MSSPTAIVTLSERFHHNDRRGPRALLCAIAAALALTAASTHVESAQAAGCTRDHIRTSVWKVGSTINGYGGTYNCSTRAYATITLQRYRGWLVGWRPLRSKSGPFNPNRAVRLSYNCAGTGTYTYRIFMNGRRVDGSPWWKKSRTLRVSC